MSTGAIIAIIAGVLILLALVVLLSRSGRQRKLEANRHEARQIRREAEVDSAQADKTRAEADVQAAEARRQEAEARQHAATAEEQERAARERHLEAARLDPDVDEREVEERYDHNHAPEGITAHGFGEESERGDGEAVEHYERTETPDVAQERRFERDEEGNVVRDEEHRQPRTAT